MWVKAFMSLGGIAGCSGIALGALSAHAFRTRIEAAGLATLGTVSQYLLVHGLLLIAVAAWLRIAPESVLLRVAGALLVLGMFCFCGGLTVGTLTGVRGFGGLAPFGGIALMAGWLTLALYGLIRV
jgi:uncharacterized membrane protein YgdD (TMEM256/DUF423 family)